MLNCYLLGPLVSNISGTQAVLFVVVIPEVQLLGFKTKFDASAANISFNCDEDDELVMAVKERLIKSVALKVRQLKFPAYIREAFPVFRREAFPYRTALVDKIGILEIELQRLYFGELAVEFAPEDIYDYNEGDIIINGEKGQEGEQDYEGELQ
ncbi:MAG: hypothetical protein EZS28_000766 [Streblomastix strix]|uniref:Uncharacterized protein n=1 Tax=Streblomastix strix TaxID=222440 RepID=A0A5J4X8X9_9EUKA|nr:MAG: hypothetical protein EZS28_000766 [Streblomastix strix]